MDGTCIPLYQRCDDIFNCDDGSDEALCSPIEINPKSYNKKFPYIKEGKLLDVETDITILSIKAVSQMDMSFTAEVAVELKWIDKRITYKNLKPKGNFLGNDNLENLWLPNVIFANTEENASILKKGSLFVEVLKEGQSKVINHNEVQEGYIYSGGENRLHLVAKVQHDFLCSFKFQNYPFDSQTCYIFLKTEQATRFYTNIVPKTLMYNGKPFTQYELC